MKRRDLVSKANPVLGLFSPNSMMTFCFFVHSSTPTTYDDFPFHELHRLPRYARPAKNAPTPFDDLPTYSVVTCIVPQPHVPTCPICGRGREPFADRCGVKFTTPSQRFIPVSPIGIDTPAGETWACISVRRLLDEGMPPRLPFVKRVRCKQSLCGSRRLVGYRGPGGWQVLPQSGW